MSNFWDEYKKRVIYGDALGPPRNATEMGAANLAKHGKDTSVAQGGSGSSEGYDFETRYPARIILLLFLAAGLIFAVIWGLKAYAADNALVSLTTGALYVLGYTAALVALFQVAVNILKFSVCGLFTLLLMRPVRYAFFAGLVALVPSGFYFETMLSWILGGILPVAAAGAAIGFLLDQRRRK